MVSATTERPKAKGETPGGKPSPAARSTGFARQNPAWTGFALGVQAKLMISSPGDPYEREADAVADQVMRMADLPSNGPAPKTAPSFEPREARANLAASVTQSQRQIARQGTIELEVEPDCPPDMICFTILNGNVAHRTLSPQDKAAIITKTSASVPAAKGPSFSKDGPRFVLHDTATSFGPSAKESKHLGELKAQDSTPVGEGAAAYVTAAGAPERTHSKFFNAQRPTATEFERANDFMGLNARETAMQQIWSLTDPVEQTAAITRFLALFPGMSSKDITNESQKAMKNLDKSQTTPGSNGAGKAVVMTTASGAVSQICDAVAAAGAAKVAVKGQDAALATACASMKQVYDARKTRIADTANVEVIADKGSDCDVSSSAQPFSGYAPAAYDAVAKLYALAALEAGQFPEITTHYFLDSTTPAGSPGPVTKAQNRCDPRCFDLDLLYAKIAAILNHLPGTTYGITPKYGTTFGTSNVWWPTNVCGSARGAPPTKAAATPAKKQSPPKKMTRVQPKLVVSSSKDPSEREADRVADSIMRTPAPQLQRACAGCAAGAAPCQHCLEEEEDHEPNIHRHTDVPADRNVTSVSSEFLEGLDAGQPLDAATRDFMEPRFGTSFGNVRVHAYSRAASSAKAIQAHAYTARNDIVFGEGRYNPATRDGQRLLAHELTHVVQQSGEASTHVQRQKEEKPLVSDDALLACLILAPPLMKPLCFGLSEEKVSKGGGGKFGGGGVTGGWSPPAAPPTKIFFHGSTWRSAQSIPGKVKRTGGGDFGQGFYTHHHKDTARALDRARWEGCRLCQKMSPSERYSGVVRFDVPASAYQSLLGGRKTFGLTSTTQKDYAARQKEWLDFVSGRRRGREADPTYDPDHMSWRHQRVNPPPDQDYLLIEGPMYKGVEGLPGSSVPPRSAFDPYAEGTELPQQVVWNHQQAMDVLNSSPTTVSQFDASKNCEPVDPPVPVPALAASIAEDPKALEAAQIEMTGH